MKQKFLSLFLAIALMLGTVVPTYAGEVNESDNIANKFEISQLAVGETETRNVTLSNGEIGTISITKVANLPDEEPVMQLFSWDHWHTKKNVTNGTYDIYVKAVAANAGFTIDVKNYKITDAYDPWHFVVMGNVSGTLTQNSSKKATYFMNFGLSIPWVGGPSWTGGVQARIEGHNLVTYWK